MLVIRTYVRGARVIVLMLLLGFAPVRIAAADPVEIAAIPIVSSVGAPGDWNSGRFTLSIAHERLFDDFVISTASIGKTFIVNASTDPQFVEAARQMTDGFGDYSEWLFGAVAGSGGGVGNLNEGALFGVEARDFKGWTISSLTLGVDDFSAARDPRFPNGTALSFRGRLAVLGTGAFQDLSPTPEPATLVLFATGGLGLIASRRRHRRRR